MPDKHEVLTHEEQGLVQEMVLHNFPSGVSRNEIRGLVSVIDRLIGVVVDERGRAMEVSKELRSLEMGHRFKYQDPDGADIFKSLADKLDLEVARCARCGGSGSSNRTGTGCICADTDREVVGGADR